jgi:hypothetical protein
MGNPYRFGRRHAAVGALVAAAIIAVPGQALAAASFSSFGFASLSATPSAGVLAVGGSVDDDTVDQDTTGTATTSILADTVLAIDEFTLQDAGVGGEALASPGGDSSAFASLSTSTSLTFLNTTATVGSIDYTFDYSADVIAALDDPSQDAVGASARVLFGTFDFATGLQTILVNELLELVSAGIDGLLNDISGSVDVAANGFIGFFVDVDVDGLAISTERTQVAVPVPATLALIAAGLLGVTVSRRGRHMRLQG